MIILLIFYKRVLNDSDGLMFESAHRLYLHHGDALIRSRQFPNARCRVSETNYRLNRAIHIQSEQKFGFR